MTNLSTAERLALKTPEASLLHILQEVTLTVDLGREDAQILSDPVSGSKKA